MIKNSFISVISQEEKEKKSGSTEFQLLHFTSRIRRLTSHLKLHKKDFLSQRGLRILLGKRQKLLIYLSKTKKVHYNKLMDQLAIREQKTR
uniref:Small ribosomal subunit protein uS15c n=2 Tax=Pogonia TaxID=78835 RepID=A0A6G7KX55_9ASPA|nr:ribosomal protein S15 [Pogonia japonica]YP_009748291.1 ribosomal protein S15 [Pogonia japonica]YP_009748363.1 ribosomal protein S15 [Pogonia minor]YP_009748367.1 ribosomal protein S15 [Pogonia minor]QII89967.1 ribosomal protein S15 [Pogonia japonica]QII89971.1 ribosomal protein S15 [Pogonia japonica]QII90043.1 ribosomal protein S15 [Pogonia minor]QII90047.1 ribosomal protein S15 [Pogonia minor]